METKICYNCKENKNTSLFSYKNKAKGIFQSNCRDCHKLYVKEHYNKNKTTYKQRAFINNTLYKKRNKQNIIEYLQKHPCSKCSNDDIDVLEFHHLHPAEKSHDICKMVHGAHSWKSILKEISKCQVLCANCHRKLHKAIKNL